LESVQGIIDASHCLLLLASLLFLAILLLQLSMILLVSLLLLASFPAYALQQLMPAILLFPCCCYTVYDIVVVSCVFNVTGKPAVAVFSAVSDVLFCQCPCCNWQSLISALA
jgi:hypothetical protein